MMKAMIWVTANWLPTEPRRSLRPLVSMSFLFSLPLKAAKRFALQAAMSAETAKSNSFNEAIITPPITGMRHNHLALEMGLP